MADLQGRDLDRAIAEAMGWGGWCEVGPTCERSYLPDDPHTHGKYWGDSHPPTFHLSLDALRDGPERLLREAGWMFDVEMAGTLMYEVVWYAPADHYSNPSVRATATTEGAARARAVLAGLRAMKEGVDGN